MSVEMLLTLLRYRRTVVTGALAAVITAAWGYLLLGEASRWKWAPNR